MMQRLRALVFSDLHMFPHEGRYSRVDDAVEALSWLEEVYFDLGCNHLFFLGDWSHNKLTTHNVVLARTQEVISRWYERGIRMTFLPGNHDCPYKTDPRDALSTIDNMRTGQPGYDGPHVHRNSFVYRYEDVEVLCTPWSGPVRRTEDYIDASFASMKAAKGHDPNRRTLFLGHLDLVGGRMTNSERAKEGLSPAWLGKRFDLSLLGHYHLFDAVTPQVFYVGSLTTTRFDEEGTRGAVLYDGGQIELIPNPVSPMHLKLRPADVTSERCKNNYVRVYCGPSDDAAMLRQAALDCGARTARCLPDIAAPAADGEEGVTLDRPACQLSDEDLLDVWIDKSAPAELDKGRLRQEGRRIIRRAREIEAKL